MDVDAVQSFLSVTAVEDPEIARAYLRFADGDVTHAVHLFFEVPGSGETILAASNPTPTASSHRPPVSTSSAARTGVRGGTQVAGAPTGFSGRQDEEGVVHLDEENGEDDGQAVGEDEHDDDDDDIDIQDDGEDGDDISYNSDIATVARAAQEEEDAAMARALQEDMYSQGPVDSEGVRAPLARTTETLIGPAGGWDGEDDYIVDPALTAYRQRQAALQTAANAGPPNPFHQSIWDDTSEGSNSANQGQSSASRVGAYESPRIARLAEAFRPPYEIMTRVSWDGARAEGKERKKWILVNVQDSSVFACQNLNRDHWKHANTVALIKDNFIFLQYDKNSPVAQEYINLYFGQGYDDTQNYPYVSIIDPRTGERVKTWSGEPFPKQEELYADLVEFLDRYSLEANSKNPVVKAKAKAKAVDVGRLTEDEMLELALKNSLETNGGSSVKPRLQDPDEFTQSPPDSGKGKGRAAEVEDVIMTDPPAPDVFSQMSSTNPHKEPAISPESTRMQFRHPSGRVIRRFAATDPVRRIYEWLKAEPLEGKEGVRFELKAQPGGDLIDKLDMTIEQAGLKSGTVMIEFVYDD